MKQNPAKYIIFAVMVVVLVGGAMMPSAQRIIHPATEYQNEGAHFNIAENGDRTLELSLGEDGYVLTDENGTTAIGTGFGAVFLVYGDGVLLRFADTGTAEVLTEDGKTSVGQITDSDTLEIAIQGGALYIGGTEYGDVWAYRDDKGGYVLADNAYVLSDSIVIAGLYGTVTTDSDTPAEVGYTAKGTVTGFGTVKAVNPVSSLTLNGTEGTIVGTAEDGLYALSKADFVSSWSDDSSSTATAEYLIVPDKVSVPNPLADKDYVNVILKCVPIFIFLALIFGIYVHIRNKDAY